MYEKIQTYKEITLKMITTVKNEPDSQEKIATLLDERQAILDSFTTTEEVVQFRVLYKDFEIATLDNEFKDLLTNELNRAKSDIIEQKKKRVANSAYSKVNRDGLSFFSKQI